ncbi:retropepsin-like aspartic protease [Cupriavidus pauculus]|uniref:retropepsin-like aspartic protease n=1 Tax=Cupriavidus pauculus TaxID=82633 RepID=UPI001EE1A122|nr:retropepsin-like aspartic protease [Cupriavidus pauculus]
MHRAAIRILIATIVAAGLVFGTIYAVIRGPDRTDEYKDILTRYRLAEMSREAFKNRELVTQLDALKREPCDKQAAWKLSHALLASQLRREAATLLTEFPKQCDAPNGFLLEAIPVLRSIGDLETARQTADRLLELSPGSDVALLARAQVLGAQKQHAAALADYEAIIKSSSAPSRLTSSVFVGAAEAQSGLGEPCKAAALLTAWIDYDPARRASPQAKAELDRYTEAGHCEARVAPTAESFARKTSGVILVRATINGHEGKFVVDTGASYVALNQGFARRAGVPNTGRAVTMESANGRHSDILTQADSVSVGKMKTTDVAVIIRTNGDLGNGIDGLLGQSYLSRFHVAIQPDRWSIGPR